MASGFDVSPRNIAFLENIDRIGPVLALATSAVVLAFWFLHCRIVDARLQDAPAHTLDQLDRLRRAVIPPMVGLIVTTAIATITRVIFVITAF